MSANATLFIALVIVFLKYLIHLVLWCFQFKDEISFLQIPETIGAAMTEIDYIKNPSLEEILETEQQTYDFITSIL